MLLPDVNVLVYAHRQDALRHLDYRNWLLAAASAETGLGLAEPVLAGFLRVVTHPRVFRSPTPLTQALRFVEALRALPATTAIRPGARHWSIFHGLCKSAEAKGNLVPDAFLAALAIESGCVWATTDRDFARFPGLRWIHPLAGTVDH